MSIVPCGAHSGALPTGTALTRRHAIGGACLLAVPAFRRASAQQGIRFICPFSAGGIVDTVMRGMADELGEALQQTVIIDNRPGANGALAMRQLLAAPPDGRTWAMATLGSTLGMMTNPAAAGSLRDVQAVALVATDISVLVVPAASPFDSLAQLLGEAARKPGGLSYLRTGEASLAHLVVGCLNRGAEAEVLAVDYRGQPAGIVDLLAGRIDLAVLNIGLAVPHIRDRRLRPLALVGARRAVALPGVPTLQELGFADANVESWAMAVVRAGTPPDRLGAVSRAFQSALSKDAVRARLADAGVIPADAGGVGEAALRLARAAARNGRLLAAIGLGAAAGASPADACRPPGRQ